jgi:hypothetical protein
VLQPVFTKAGIVGIEAVMLVIEKRMLAALFAMFFSLPKPIYALGLKYASAYSTSACCFEVSFFLFGSQNLLQI